MMSHHVQKRSKGGPDQIFSRVPRISDAEAQELLRAFTEGDQESFDRLIEIFSPMLFGVFITWFRLSVEDAEDLFQETFLQLFLKADHISRVRPWLLGTAINQARKRVRKLIRDRNLLRRFEEERQMRTPCPDDGERDMVQKALKRLPPGDRHLLELMYYSGMSYKEASKYLDRPIGSIGPMRSRALHRLGREILDLDKGLHAA